MTPNVEKLNAQGLLECYRACQEFVRKCEAGEARSRRSYVAMKEAIEHSENLDYRSAGKGVSRG